MLFRASSGTFGSAFRSESSTGTLYRALAREIERRPIVRADADRFDLGARLAGWAEQGGPTVYACALLPDHARFLVRTGGCPLSQVMRSLLTPPCGAPSTPAAGGASTSNAQLDKSDEAAKHFSLTNHFVVARNQGDAWGANGAGYPSRRANRQREGSAGVDGRPGGVRAWVEANEPRGSCPESVRVAG